MDHRANFLRRIDERHAHGLSRVAAGWYVLRALVAGGCIVALFLLAACGGGDPDEDEHVPTPRACTKPEDCR